MGGMQGGPEEDLRQRKMFPGGKPLGLFEPAGDRKIWVSALRADVLLPDGCQTLEDAFSQEYALDS